jgi:hypothetical protein
MKRLIIALALVAFAPIAAHAETNLEAYQRGWSNGYSVAERVAAYCRMATLDATYPIDPQIQGGCRSMQEAFDKVQKEDQKFLDKLQKEVFEKLGRQR